MIEELNRLFADAATDPELRDRMRAGDLRAVLAEYGLQETRLAHLAGSPSLQLIARAATNLLQDSEKADPVAPPSASEGLRLLASSAIAPTDETIPDHVSRMPAPTVARRKQPTPRSVTAAPRP